MVMMWWLWLFWPWAQTRVTTKPDTQSYVRRIKEGAA